MTRVLIVGGIIAALLAAVGFQQWRLEGVLEKNGQLAAGMATLAEANRQNAQAVDKVTAESRAREAATAERLARAQAEQARLAAANRRLEGLADENAALRKQLDLVLHPCLVGWLWGEAASGQERDCTVEPTAGLVGPDADAAPAGDGPAHAGRSGPLVQGNRPGTGPL